jgi:hypothetical protein
VRSKYCTYGTGPENGRHSDRAIGVHAESLEMVL